ncbi:L,D-transpeptidase family protein [Sphingomonas sp.]|uniref:L,D-transpeptidase family protein n=1 Tax=Sphingomonas sp. TaxID=28214 RepID=UPI0039C8D134
MRKQLFIALCLAGASLGSVASGQTNSSSRPPIDNTILHAQVILDHLGFSPGILDGREGQSLTAALKGFQTSRGMTVSGKLDPATLSALYPYRALRPMRTLTLDVATIAGPYVNPMPKDPEDQSKLPSLAYTRPIEKLAEMFHTTPEVLVELNPGGGEIKPGATFVFPNALPSSRDYPSELREDWRKTLSDLNVDANQPTGDRIVVDKSEKALKVYNGEQLVAQFSVTTGSEHDPLPIGTWKVNGADYNPKFHYNPDLFWDAKKGDDPAMLPPGPNGPVGVVWLDLSKEHYGIHGTPEPQTIGRTQSHGCIRLTNWDAARLSLMIKPATPAVFQE